MISPLNDVAVETAALLLATTGASTRAALVASVIVDLIPAPLAPFTGSFLKMAMPPGPPSAEPETVLPGRLAPSESRLVLPLLAEIHAGGHLFGLRSGSEDYAHLGVPRSVASLAYVPLLSDGGLARRNRDPHLLRRP